MDFQLTSEQRQMVATVRAVTQDHFKGRALKFMDGTFPWENVKELARLGILGMTVPRNTAASGFPCWTRHWCSKKSPKVAS